MRAGEVFPNMVRAELVRGEADEAAPDVEDNDAFYEGDPFLVAEEEEEWVGWVDGEAEPAAAAEGATRPCISGTPSPREGERMAGTAAPHATTGTAAPRSRTYLAHSAR